MSEQSSVTIVRAVSPSATHAAAPSGLMARWCAPWPTGTRSATRPVSRSIAETEPAAASLTSAQWPPGATAAIWGERKPRSTAIGRSVRGRRIVTVPDCGLTATAGPAPPAATVVGCAASRDAADHAAAAERHGEHLVLALGGDERHRRTAAGVGRRRPPAMPAGGR